MEEIVLVLSRYWESWALIEIASIAMTSPLGYESNSKIDSDPWGTKFFDHHSKISIEIQFS